MLVKKKEISMYVAVCLIAFHACLLEISFSSDTLPLPSMPDTSIFKNEIDRNKYTINKQPNGAKLFRWDFSNTNQYVYGYMKKSVINDFTNILGTESGRNTREIILNARLFINSLGNQTADIVLKDLKTVVRYWKEEKKNKQTKTKLPSIPLIAITSIDERGLKKDEIKNDHSFTDLLFPLPNKPLKLREQTAIDRSVPIAINNKIFTIVGKLKITLTDYVNINGRNCARFESIANIKNTINLNGKDNKCAIKAHTVYYFDIEDRCLVSGGSALLISIRYEDTATRQKFVEDNHILILMTKE